MTTKKLRPGCWVNVLYRDALFPADDELITGIDLPILEPDTLLMHIQQKPLGRELKSKLKPLHKLAEEGNNYDKVAVEDPFWP
jgi:hypothetical protein